jgi:hypothetical protein
MMMMLAVVVAKLLFLLGVEVKIDSVLLSLEAEQINGRNLAICFIGQN